MPIFNGPPKVRRGTSLGAPVRALWEALTAMIEEIDALPSERRARLRTHRALLEKAYPALLVTDTDVAWEADPDAEVPHDV